MDLSVEYIQRHLRFLSTALQRPVICAGGAPRDLYNNKPVSDLDFYVDRYQLGIEEAIKTIQSLYRYPSKLMKEVGEEHDYHGEYYISPKILEIQKEPYKIQVMFCNYAASDLEGVDFGCWLVDYFDIDLCRAFITKSVPEIHCREEFASDILNKTITYTRTHEDPERKQKRLDKIKTKYPDFTVVDKTEKDARDLELITRGLPEPIVEDALGNIGQDLDATIERARTILEDYRRTSSGWELF